MNDAGALLLALGLGLLRGLERGWRLRDEHDGGRIAGIRTLALLGLGGGLCGLGARTLSSWIAIAGMVGMFAALLLAHRARLQEVDDNVSATNAVVSIMTALIGLQTTLGHLREAMIAAGAITLLLSMRDQLHGWLHTLSARDIRAAAHYGAITLVVLPLLPDRMMGPYEALNPRMIWLVVVFVTGLSFAGYWASKHFGQRVGTIAAAAIGATYSSTAVTLELARRLRAPDADRATLNAGIAAATAIMPVRVLILCAIIAPFALEGLLQGIGAAVLFGIVYAAVAFLLARRAETKREGGLEPAQNPFDFWPAIGFAALVAAIVLLSRWTIDHYGNRGVELFIGLTGIYDVDAAIIAAANLGSLVADWRLLGILFSLPIFINSLIKLVLVLAIAGIGGGWRAALPLGGTGLLIGFGMAWLSL